MTVTRDVKPAPVGLYSLPNEVRLPRQRVLSPIDLS